MKTYKTKHHLQPILEQIRKQFYPAEHDKKYHRDRKMLIYAISWPATWLNERNLSITNKHYTQIINQNINEIKQHGNPKLYQQYFPRYLLKVIQQWFIHYGDELYFKIKNSSYIITAIMQKIKNMPNEPKQSNAPLHIYQQTHQLLKQLHKRKSKKRSNQQMTLPL